MAYRDAGAEGEAERLPPVREQFVELYNEYGEDHPKASTLLFNAGECYEAAYLLGQSVRMRKLLLDKFPNSEHFQGTLSKLAGNYQAIAFYDEAAERYRGVRREVPQGQASRRTPCGTPTCSGSASGRTTKASDNLVKYEGLYKKKDNPELAAKIFWSKHDILKTDEEKLKHAEEYLKIYGKKGGPDRADRRRGRDRSDLVAPARATRACSTTRASQHPAQA